MITASSAQPLLFLALFYFFLIIHDTFLDPTHGKGPADSNVTNFKNKMPPMVLYSYTLNCTHKVKKMSNEEFLMQELVVWVVYLGA